MLWTRHIHGTAGAYLLTIRSIISEHRLESLYQCVIREEVWWLKRCNSASVKEILSSLDVNVAGCSVSAAWLFNAVNVKTSDSPFRDQTSVQVAYLIHLLHPWPWRHASRYAAARRRAPDWWQCVRWTFFPGNVLVAYGLCDKSHPIMLYD